MDDQLGNRPRLSSSPDVSLIFEEAGGQRSFWIVDRTADKISLSLALLNIFPGVVSRFSRLLTRGYLHDLSNICETGDLKPPKTK